MFAEDFDATMMLFDYRLNEGQTLPGGPQSLAVDERYCRGDWNVAKTAASNATIGVALSVIERIQRLNTLEVEVNWGGHGAKKKFKVVRSSEPSDLVFQSPPNRSADERPEHPSPAPASRGGEARN
jgi:hypothetical protein